MAMTRRNRHNRRAGSRKNRRNGNGNNVKPNTFGGYPMNRKNRKGTRKNRKNRRGSRKH